MAQDRLQDALETLHRELADPATLTEENRALLETVAEDLRQALEEEEHEEGLRERIQDATLEFEAEHPRLSATLGEIVQALARMGI